MQNLGLQSGTHSSLRSTAPGKEQNTSSPGKENCSKAELKLIGWVCVAEVWLLENRGRPHRSVAKDGFNSSN